jgi:hypothetical protein
MFYLAGFETLFWFSGSFSIMGPRLSNGQDCCLLISWRKAPRSGQSFGFQHALVTRLMMGLFFECHQELLQILGLYLYFKFVLLNRCKSKVLFFLTQVTCSFQDYRDYLKITILVSKKFLVVPKLYCYALSYLFYSQAV